MEGSGNFDRASLTGKLALRFDRSLAAQSDRACRTVRTLACRSARMRLGTGPGPVRTRLVLDLGKDKTRADGPVASASLDLDAPQLKGSATLTAMPELSALGGNRSRCAQAHRVQP